MTMTRNCSNSWNHLVWWGRIAAWSMSGLVTTTWPALRTADRIGAGVSPSYVDAETDNPARKFAGLIHIAVMVIEADMLGTRQATRIAGRHHPGVEAVGDIHDARIDILHVGDPQVDGPGAEDQLGADGVGQRIDAAVPVE